MDEHESEADRKTLLHQIEKKQKDRFYSESLDYEDIDQEFVDDALKYFLEGLHQKSNAELQTILSNLELHEREQQSNTF